MEIYMIEVCVNYLEFLCYYILTAAFLGIGLKKNAIRLIYGVASSVAIFFLQDIIGIGESVIGFITMMIILFVTVFLVYRESILNMLVSCVITYMITSVFGYIQLLILNQFIADIGDLVYGVIPLTAMLIDVTFIYFIYLIMRKKQLRLAVHTRKAWYFVIMVFSFVATMLINKKWHANPDTFLVSLVVYVAILIYVFSVFVEMIIAQQQEEKYRYELQMYQSYMPIVEKLIDEIREKQHGYSNAIQSIKSLAYVEKDFESLKNALLTQKDESDILEYEIDVLKLNYHLLAGFIMSKTDEAKDKHIELRTEIVNYTLESKSPEYALVEMIGILIDNALEETECGDWIGMMICSTEERTVCEVNNRGEISVDEFIKKAFKSGYSTKGTSLEGRGYGLFRLKNLIEKYDGTIEISNKTIANEKRIVFRIEV